MSDTGLLSAFDNQALEQGCLTVPQIVQVAAADSGAPVQAGAEGAATSYVMDETGLLYMKPTRDGETPVRLTNFTAKIESEVIRDDGAEITRYYVIEAKLGGRPRTFQVPSGQYSNMNWATEHLGATAVVYPGTALKDHARAAIQLLSGQPKERRVFSHTGWRKLDSGWAYLHASGAISEAGAIDGLQVELSPPLDIFELPKPPQGDALKASVRTSLGMLDVAPDRVSVPLLAAVYRSVLGPAEFSVHLAGPSGAGKSEIAALAQQHFGAAFTAKRLPGSWSSTGNSLELLAFSAKDTMLVVDDFAPAGSQQDVQRMHRDADRLFRAQGNRSGRQRARPDGSLRPVKGPRGLVVSTGEDVPRTYSVRARIFIVEVDPQDMDWKRLSGMQQAAADGAMAQAMSGYVQWLAGRYQQVLGSLAEETRKLRERASMTPGHKRTPDIVANLAHGFNMFLTFAVEAGSVTAEERADLEERMWKALGQVSEAQCDHQASAEPAQRFIELLRTALVSGQAHVAFVDGSSPANFMSWGWRERESYFGEEKRTSEVVPQGTLVGWTNGIDLYIDADAAVKAIQSIAAATGDAMGIGPRTLTKRLQQRGMLASIDEARGRLTVRKTLQGTRREVLHLKAGSVVDVVAASSDAPQPAANEIEPAKETTTTPGVKPVKATDAQRFAALLRELRQPPAAHSEAMPT